MSSSVPGGGRDPHQPFHLGQPTYAAPGSATPGPRGPRWWLLLPVALLVFALIGWLVSVLVPRRPATDDAATPTPAASSPRQATPTAASPSSRAASPSASPSPTLRPTIQQSPATSVPFTSPQDNASGTFQILSHHWTGQALVLQVRVSLDSGTQRLGFFALENEAALQHEPEDTTADRIEGVTLTAGQSATGVLVFTMPRTDATIFLTGSDGRQVQALVVKA